MVWGVGANLCLSPHWQVVEAAKEYIDLHFPREAESSTAVAAEAAGCSPTEPTGKRRPSGYSEGGAAGALADPSSATMATAGISTINSSGVGGAGDTGGCPAHTPWWWENEEADPELIRR